MRVSEMDEIGRMAVCTPAGKHEGVVSDISWQISFIAELEYMCMLSKQIAAGAKQIATATRREYSS